MKHRLARIIDAVLPRGTRRRAAMNWIAVHALPRSFMLAAGTGEARPHAAYRRWIEEVEPALYASTEARANAIPNPPLISVVVPTYNTPARYFEPLVQSLLDQVYPHWELCIADGSDDEAAAARIRAAATIDPRVRYRQLEANEGISGNTNRGIEMAAGEFVALLDHDDTLSRFALAEVALALESGPDVDLVYTDEDKLSEDGSTRSYAVLKPDWSPEMLLGGNYITHLTVVRRTLLDAIGGERSAYDGAQDYDLVLRASERARRIVHIPKVLYHWRLAEGSTAVTVASKDYAGDAGRRALADAIARRGVDAEVLRVPQRETFYRVRYRLPAERPRVSIIVPFRDEDVAQVRRCVRSVASRTGYAPYEILLVAADPEGRLTRELRTEAAHGDRERVIDGTEGRDYGSLVRSGRAAARGQVLVLLHADVEATQEDWLGEIVAVSSQPGVGAVSPLMRYPGGAIQQAGIVVGLGGGAGHPWRWRDQRSFTFFGSAEWPRDFIGVSGACLCIQADRFDAAGGMPAGGAEADVLLGLALADAGLRNVYWPYVSLRHYEGLPDERDGMIPASGLAADLASRLPHGCDPYFNPNLDPWIERIELRTS